MNLKEIDKELNRLEKLRVAAVKVETRNKEFAKLTKAQKRVEVAKEVLALIKMGKLEARSGVYFSSESDESDESDEEKPYIKGKVDLQQALIEQGSACNACALGGLAMAAIVRGNNAYVNANGDEPLDLVIDYAVSPDHAASPGSQKIQSLFSVDQLAMIEEAFEGNSIGLFGPSRKDWDPALFWQKYPDDEKRLQAIMKNIIANKGTFKP